MPNKPIKYKTLKVEISLLKDTSLTAMELAILFRLLTNNKNFKPSICAMATILHTTPKGIRTATDKLQKKGYLKIIKLYKQRAIWKVSQTKEFLKESATK